MSVEKAIEALDRAKRHLERVQSSAWEPEDHEEAVTWAFYAYENCVTALAELHGRPWTKNHYKKAELARELHAEGLVSRDIGDELEDMNRLRKDVAYGQPGPELQERNLEELAGELKSFIDEIDSRIASFQ